MHTYTMLLSDLARCRMIACTGRIPIRLCRYNKCVMCMVYTLYEYGYILPEPVAPYKYIGTWLTNKAATIK